MGKPSSDCFVSAIAPLHNDGAIVGAFVAEIMAVLRAHYDNYELILVDNGSEDATETVATELLCQYECVRWLQLSRHSGVETAISCGLDTAIGDFVVVLLPNVDPPAIVPKAIARCRSGWDILIGTRANRDGEPLWFRWGTALFYWVARHLFDISLPQNATQFRVLSRQVVNAIARVPDKSRYLRLLGSYTGYKSEPFIYQPLQSRQPTRTFDEAIALGLQIILVNSKRPLWFASALCLVVSLANFAAIPISTFFATRSDATGFGWQWLLLNCTFGTLALVVAVLCQYISLIYRKSRDWAAYYVADEKNSAVLCADRDRRNIVEASLEQ